MSYEYSENILVQESSGKVLKDKLGWDVVFAYNTEVLGENGTLGRKSYNEIVLVRYLKKALFDNIVIESLSRLGRSVKNLAELMELFNSRNIRLVSMKETIDTTSSTGRLLFTILSSLAQFERDVLVERTREGLSAARARGRMGGRPKINETAVNKAIALYNTKQYSIKEITELTGVSRSTMYRAIKG